MHIAFGIYCIIKKKNSHIKIAGTFLRCNVYKNRYSPVFQYEFKSIEHESQTWERISRRQAQKYIFSQQYTLYVNENKPNQVCLSRKISPSDWFMIGLGIIFLLEGFFCLI